MRAFGSVLVFLAACQTVPSRNEKPQAAVDVRVAERDLGGGDHEVTLTATPTRDVDGLELVLDGQRTRVGASHAGEAHTVTVRASGDRDVIGTAWVGHRSKSAHVHL